MGLLDGILSNFLQDRGTDFIKLEKDDTIDELFGPKRPILICYNIPDGITNEELYDMLQDGAPKASASSKGVIIKRINDGDRGSGSTSSSSSSNELLDLSLQAALDKIVEADGRDDNDATVDTVEGSSSNVVGEVSLLPTTTTEGSGNANVPVLLFSGFYNSEMINTYNIVGKEIYDETYGVCNTACAKVVPNAMNKPLQQVFNEIVGDHVDAMSSLEEIENDEWCWRRRVGRLIYCGPNKGTFLETWIHANFFQ